MTTPVTGPSLAVCFWIPRGQAQEHHETEYRECAATAESKCDSLAQPERFAHAYSPLATTAKIPLSDKITVSAGSRCGGIGGHG